MVNGKGLMVNVAWVVQPVEPAVNVIVAIPPAAPVTSPDADPTLAIPVLLLLHRPLPSVNVVVDPAHNTVIPLIAGGNGFTVTIVLVKHPAPIE
jgi:hypothetical protein